MAQNKRLAGIDFISIFVTDLGCEMILGYGTISLIHYHTQDDPVLYQFHHTDILSYDSIEEIINKSEPITFEKQKLIEKSWLYIMKDNFTALITNVKGEK